MAINIDAEKCIGCGICAKECPFEAVTMVAGAGGKKLPDIGNGCTECGRCVEACPKIGRASCRERVSVGV